MTAAERQSGNAGRTDHAAGRGHTKRLGLMVEFAPREPSFGATRPVVRADMEAFHTREVKHQATLAPCNAGQAVAPAPHGYPQLVLAGEPDAGEDVRDTGAAGDQRGPPVDHAIMDFAGVFVTHSARTQERTAQARFKCLDHSVLKLGISALHRGDSQLSHRAPPWIGKK